MNITTPTQHLDNLARLSERDEERRKAEHAAACESLRKTIEHAIALARTPVFNVRIDGVTPGAAVAVVLADYRLAGWQIVGPLLIHETHRPGVRLCHSPPLREYTFTPTQGLVTP